MLNENSNKHLLHRTEEIHPHSSRPFLVDPSKPRLDHAASLTGFRDRSPSPIQKINKAHKALIEAQNKVNETAERLEIANYYERVYSCK